MTATALVSLVRSFLLSSPRPLFPGNFIISKNYFRSLPAKAIEDERHIGSRGRSGVEQDEEVG